MLAPKMPGHHTIPVYMCGSMGQEVSQITFADHVAIHAEIAMIRFALDGAEEYATRTIGRNRSATLSRVAQTEPGRASIVNSLQMVYDLGGWSGRGVRPIGTVLASERYAFVSGAKTSLPWCSRNGSP